MGITVNTSPQQITASVGETKIDVSVSGGIGPSGLDGGGYTLPTATASVLGGVKIGAGVTITDGVISVSTDYAPASHASTHAPGGADELYDQSLNTDDSPTFASLGLDGQGDADWVLDGNNGPFTIRIGVDTVFSVDDTGLIEAASIDASAVIGLSAVAISGSYADLISTPSTFAPSAHKTSHATGGSDALTASDIGAAAASHNHAWSDITSGVPSTFTPSAHNHAASEITSGTLDAARLPLATTGAAGAIVVGSGLSVSSGTLSAAVTSVAGRTGAVTIAAADVSGLAAVATSGSASDLSAGTVPIARLPTGTTSTTVAIGNHTHAASDIASGVIATARLASSGTASATTWLRGDQTWSSIPAGGSTNVWIPASALIPRTTTGPGVDSRETSTNRQNFDEVLFDAGTNEFAQALVVMPSNYNSGTVTARFYWTSSAGSGDVIWGLQGRAFADDDALDTAHGTAQTVADTLLATNDMHVSAATSAITIGGTPAANRPVQFQVYRDAAASGDTIANDCRLLGVEIIYTAA